MLIYDVSNLDSFHDLDNWCRVSKDVLHLSG